MQADLHYYVTFIAARASGWGHEDAAEIALAAHYVDCSGDPDSLYTPWENSESLQHTITCVAQLWKAKENMRTMPPQNQVVWSAFHFLPGFDSDPAARYDFAYDDRPWANMAGDGVKRRVPGQVAKQWVYAQAKQETGYFATPRAWKLAMRCFPNSRTIAAMTADTVTQLQTLGFLRTSHDSAARLPFGTAGDKYVSRSKARQVREQALALIGVRLHVLADSFSHAGFAGTTSSINKEDGSWLLIDPTKTNQKEIEINYALGSHGVAKWMAVGHAMAGALPDMPGARYCFQSPKLDVRIYKDNPTTYKHAIVAIRQFLTDMRQHVPPRLVRLEEPGAVPEGPVSVAEAAEQQRFAALFTSMVGGAGGPIFLTDEDFQFPHKSNRATGFAGRHITSWFWGSNMWEYNAAHADASLELRNRKLLAKIHEIVPPPAPRGRATKGWHEVDQMLSIPSAHETAFQKIEQHCGLGSTYISNKNTEYSIIRRVRVKYFQQTDTVPKFCSLRAADWAARHHATWFDSKYGPAIRREIAKDALAVLAGHAD